VTEGQNRIVRAFLDYRDAIVRMLLRLSVRPEDVDDILQESLARAMEADRAGGVELPKSYLFAISRHMVFREQERRMREVQMEITAPAEIQATYPVRRCHFEPSALVAGEPSLRF
jgi:DNA-directed RNA polymerase specialized sigma24 family protein